MPVALALQYDDSDFVVAHFSVTQSAWNLRHSKSKCMLERRNSVLPVSAWRYPPQMLMHHSSPQSLFPTIVATTSQQAVPLVGNRRLYHYKCVRVKGSHRKLQLANSHLTSKLLNWHHHSLIVITQNQRTKQSFLRLRLPGLELALLLKSGQDSLGSSRTHCLSMIAADMGKIGSSTFNYSPTLPGGGKGQDQIALSGTSESIHTTRHVLIYYGFTECIATCWMCKATCYDCLVQGALLCNKLIYTTESYDDLYYILASFHAGAPRRFGTQVASLTKTIKSILDRYPEGGQILKVLFSVHCTSICLLNYLDA